MVDTASMAAMEVEDGGDTTPNGEQRKKRKNVGCCSEWMKHMGFIRFK